ncbi:MAG: hypothetical protein DRI54_03595 [Bacteroidetes bacterium]|nr:MAG: hypothetical protein DRI54_03595 [Bacteroidota bacterium]
MNLINTLSNHLFWDVDVSTIDTKTHSKYIIKKVLQYGFYEDWKSLRKFYGLDIIVRTAVNIKDLDRRTASFLSLIANVPKVDFLCYTSKQSMPKHWNF